MKLDESDKLIIDMQTPTQKERDICSSYVFLHNCKFMDEPPIEESESMELMSAKANIFITQLSTDMLPPNQVWE